jgi:acyl-coenzyme A thioesterase PaaI-like protein
MYNINLNMELLKIIPFAQYLGIKPKDRQCLTLELKPNVHNHIGTLHAAAQFTLAETQSGLFLLSLFPDHAEEMMPLLRSSNLKYKHPATTELTAFASVDKASKEKFEEQYLKKGRAVLTINVELKDAKGTTTMVSEFGWYVQKSTCAL